MFFVFSHNYLRWEVLQSVVFVRVCVVCVFINMCWVQLPKKRLDIEA